MKDITKIFTGLNDEEKQKFSVDLGITPELLDMISYVLGSEKYNVDSKNQKDEESNLENAEKEIKQEDNIEEHTESILSDIEELFDPTITDNIDVYDVLSLIDNLDTDIVGEYMYTDKIDKINRINLIYDGSYEITIIKEITDEDYFEIETNKLEKYFHITECIDNRKITVQITGI